MISVVICTFERHSIVLNLINSLLDELEHSDEILIIDSSEELLNITNNKVRVYRSIHKNQLYQRLLGRELARNSWCLFLDDDMLPKHRGTLAEIKTLRSQFVEPIGFAINFENYYEQHSLSVHENTDAQKNFYKTTKRFFGISSLPPGKVGWNGARGTQPQNGHTEWFSGGAFYVKREYFFTNMDYRMLSLFERKIGMAEDLLLSYGLSATGKLIAVDRSMFWHMDNSTNSNYSTNVYRYEKRVMTSRLLINLFIANIKQEKVYRAIVLYNLYFLSKIVTTILFTNTRKKDRLLGQINGYFWSFNILFWDKEKHKKYWHKRLRFNLEEYNE